ncbi:MAG: acylphosphatase [Cyanobacteria bacterium]|nr:acylphosphatase [Cyanobacteriota bacterium]
MTLPSDTTSFSSNSATQLVSPSLETVRLIISGWVQGVGFRFALREQALLLGVCGWCRNLPDGRVETMFQGTDKAVSKLTQWCHQGPGQANVTSVSLEIINLQANPHAWDGPDHGFEIRF